MDEDLLKLILNQPEKPKEDKSKENFEIEKELPIIQITYQHNVNTMITAEHISNSQINCGTADHQNPSGSEGSNAAPVEVAHFSKEFSRTLQNIQNAYKESNKSSQLLLTAKLLTTDDPDDPLIPGVEKVATIVELFQLITEQHKWSWLDIGLLTVLLEVSPCEKASQILKDYIKMLRDNAETRLKIAQESPVPTEGHWIKLKEERDHTKVTLKVLLRHKEHLIRHFGVPAQTLTFSHAYKGCVTSCWYITSEGAAAVFREKLKQNACNEENDDRSITMETKLITPKAPGTSHIPQEQWPVKWILALIFWMISMLITCITLAMIIAWPERCFLVKPLMFVGLFNSIFGILLLVRQRNSSNGCGFPSNYSPKYSNDEQEYQKLVDKASTDGFLFNRFVNKKKAGFSSVALLIIGLLILILYLQGPGQEFRSNYMRQFTKAKQADISFIATNATNPTLSTTAMPLPDMVISSALLGSFLTLFFLTISVILVLLVAYCMYRKRRKYQNDFQEEEDCELGRPPSIGQSNEGVTQGGRLNPIGRWPSDGAIQPKAINFIF